MKSKTHVTNFHPTTKKKAKSLKSHDHDHGHDGAGAFLFCHNKYGSDRKFSGAFFRVLRRPSGNREEISFSFTSSHKLSRFLKHVLTNTYRHPFPHTIRDMICPLGQIFFELEFANTLDVQPINKFR